LAKLKSEDRRNKILEVLSDSTVPISGSTLAERFGVSRQVIVTDIAILRAKRSDIMATNNGYIMMHSDTRRRIFKVRHEDNETRDELMSIVNLGGKILDVFIEHRVYGTIRAPLDLSSKRDVDNFMHDLTSGVSTPLKNVTFGYHYHTIEARSEIILDEIGEMLKEKGYLIEVLESTKVYSPKSYGSV